MRIVSACLFVIIIFCATELHDCKYALFSLPVPDRRYRDYFYNNTHHEYTPSETGNDIFGYYLAYKLGKLTTPTYSHKSFYDGNRPLYDHYTIHQYFHQQEAAVAARQEIPSNKIMGCVGDTTEVCPTNTTSFCTKDGKLMCVTPTTSTVLCKDQHPGNLLRCVKSAISCHHNKSPLCLDNPEATIPVNIICISTIKIHGHVNITNNTILEAPAGSNTTDTFFINVRSATKSEEPTHVIKISDSRHYSNRSPLYADIIENGKPTSSTDKINQEFCITVVAVPSATIKT